MLVPETRVLTLATGIVSGLIKLPLVKIITLSDASFVSLSNIRLLESSLIPEHT